MRRPLLRLALVVAVLPSAVLAADANSARLQQLLKQYPEADTNKDGVLSMEEAQAYAKVLRRGSRTAPNPDEDGTAPASSTPRPAPTFVDVSYGPHERNKLDLWLAKSDRPTPLVVFIHGGGFVNGSKSGASAKMIQGCLDAGVSFMAINYRFRVSAPIQDILRDCARSIQFVRSKAAEYNIDPRRIASYGGSAGAGTSLWLAFHPDLADPNNADPVLRESSRLAAAGAINTQATYNTLRWPDFLGAPGGEWQRAGEVAAFYGAKSDADLQSPRMKAVLNDVDMLSLITRDDPPVFLYTSQPDGEITTRGHYLHHPKHALEVKKACDLAGVRALVYFAMAEPRLGGDYQNALLAFLLQQLQP